MPREQVVIAAIGLPCDIESVAENRNCSDQHIERKVDHHARKCYVRHSAKPRRNYDYARSESSKNVARERNEADDPVDSETDSGARKAKTIFEPVRKPI